MTQHSIDQQQTLKTIQMQHEELLLQNDEIDEIDIKQVQTFLKTIAQAGLYIENSPERSLLRNLIRYWSGIINDKTGKFPVVQLQPFNGTQAVSRTDNYALSKMDTAVAPPSTQHALEGRQTLWNWLQLLIIPIVLAAGVIWFSMQQSQISFQVSQQQRQNELNIAADQQRETTLQTYLNLMSDLLLNPNIHTFGQQGDAARTLSRTRTLIVLQQLDGPRKAIVLKFLYSGGLIKRQDPQSHNVEPVVNVTGADFGGVDLEGSELGGADLAGVNLSRANLIGTDLSATYLSNANLSGADLTGANLSNADLTGVKLSNAHLTDVDWKNTTCPDGTNSNANSSGSCV